MRDRGSERPGVALQVAGVVGAVAPGRVTGSVTSAPLDRTCSQCASTSSTYTYIRPPVIAAAPASCRAKISPFPCWNTAMTGRRGLIALHAPLAEAEYLLQPPGAPIQVRVVQKRDDRADLSAIAAPRYPGSAGGSVTPEGRGQPSGGQRPKPGSQPGGPQQWPAPKACLGRAGLAPARVRLADRAQYSRPSDRPPERAWRTVDEVSAGTVLPGRRGKPGLTLAVLGLAAIAFSVLQSLVIPVLPDIGRNLDVSEQAVTWVLTGYLLSASVATPILGRLRRHVRQAADPGHHHDRAGRGIVIAGLATTLAVLLVGRIVQGVGGALFPLAFAIIRDELPANGSPGRSASSPPRSASAAGWASFWPGRSMHGSATTGCSGRRCR